jgi:hypothetical protein
MSAKPCSEFSKCRQERSRQEKVWLLEQCSKGLQIDHVKSFKETNPAVLIRCLYTKQNAKDFNINLVHRSTSEEIDI